MAKYSDARNVQLVIALLKKYGIRNVMPPQRETMMGKRQMLPMPTAEPMQARMKPHLLLKDSLFFMYNSSHMCSLPHWRTSLIVRELR